MQIIHDGSNSAEYFYKGIDHCYYEKIKKQKSTDKIPVEKDSTRIILLATTEKQSQDWLKSKVDQLINHETVTGNCSVSDEVHMPLSVPQICIVILDYYRDSMINLRYIKETLDRGHRTSSDQMMIFVEHIESDAILRIEDSYDHGYRYRKLSRQYKRALKQVMVFMDSKNETGTVLSDVHKKSKSSFLKRRTRREVYANRSVVE